MWGVVTHHGRAYAVIDLRVFFNVGGGATSPPEPRIITLESHDRDIALLVDGLLVP